ncbi:MAG: hypothetical protein EON54_22325 [Alcaligenaceae bacterium]|nr:MAG: hypothetical protein EON54_22325 [Alcaligenaceae bacterium]
MNHTIHIETALKELIVMTSISDKIESSGLLLLVSRSFQEVLEFYRVSLTVSKQLDVRSAVIYITIRLKHAFSGIIEGIQAQGLNFLTIYVEGIILIFNTFVYELTTASSMLDRPR